MTEEHVSPAVARRGFIKGGLAGVAALAALGPLEALSARTAGAAPMAKVPESPDYGPLSTVKDQTTGLELLALPKGFEYVSYGWTGDVMSDGIPTPGAHDGMAAFHQADGRIALVRNHELGGDTRAVPPPPDPPPPPGGP